MAGIYIHIPFCASKCVYCGFYSIANILQKPDFIHSLLEEIRLRSTYLGNESIHTLYFGGGTPSLLATAEVKQILDALRTIFPINQVQEITLEANPEQLTTKYCEGLLAAGINRLSIGIQSFQDSVLQFMGRRHNAKEAIAAVNNAVEAGFQNISIDLIYGVSERSDAQWQQDLVIALGLPIQHLSCYALTPEENSILYKQIQHHKHAPVDDEQAARQYNLLLAALPHSDFQHYEVSNFAIPGFESKHNSSYWDHTPYLGLGPSAHSFDGHSRQWNPSNLKQYIINIAQHQDCEECEVLTEADLFNETILLGLRTRNGIDLVEVEKRFGRERKEQLLHYFTHEVRSDFYEQKESRLRLTEAGLWFADGIAADAFVE